MEAEESPLLTKLFVPQARPNDIVRPDLVACLNRMSSGKLTVALPRLALARQPPYPLPSELANANPLLFLPFVFLQQTLIGSSMGEELGWRGYALPRLEAHRKALNTSILLGIAWALWHLPLWLSKGYPLTEGSVAWAGLGIVADSILFTWVYNNTRGSLLLALLFHTSIAVTALFLSSAESPAAIGLALQWGAVILIVMVFGAEQLSREPAPEAGPSVQ
jgi:membrane protease YdiL (CAAX protease family)